MKQNFEIEESLFIQDLFKQSDYVGCLKQVLLERRRGFKTVLSKAMGCQASYLNQVLKGVVHLTEEQAFRFCKFFKCSKTETEYFLDLVRYSRAGAGDYRNHISAKLKEQREGAAEIKAHISASIHQDDEKFAAFYYSDRLPSLLHIATSSPRFQTIESLVRVSGCSLAIVGECLKRLQEFGLVRTERGKWVYSQGEGHLPRESVFSSSFQIQRRLLAIDSISKKNHADLHYTTIFTADPEDFEAIKSALLKRLVSDRKRISASGTERLYGLTLDLFGIEAY